MKTIDRRTFLLSLAAGAAATRVAAADAPAIQVWKDPSCGCCNEWVKHLKNAGFTVQVHDTGNTAARARAGVGSQYASCHTATIGGYAIEGHVPAREIKRLLKEKPEAIGLAVPGMPVGSPGMEQGKQVDPYEVLLLKKDGGASTYAKYPR